MIEDTEVAVVLCAGPCDSLIRWLAAHSFCVALRFSTLVCLRNGVVVFREQEQQPGPFF